MGDSNARTTNPSDFSKQTPGLDDSSPPLLSPSTRNSSSSSKSIGGRRGGAGDKVDVANETLLGSISKPPPAAAPQHVPPLPSPPPPPPSKDRSQISNNQTATSKPSDQPSPEEPRAPVENVDEGDYASPIGAAPHSRLPTDITATLGDGGRYGNIEPVYRAKLKKRKFILCYDCGFTSSSEDEGPQHPPDKPTAGKTSGPMHSRDNLRKAIDDGANLDEIKLALKQWLSLSVKDTSYNPMLQAAMKNDIEVCQLLKDEEHLKITDPHDYFCDCYLDRNDTLNHALYRVNAYRAMTSSSYLLTQKDPVNSALKFRQKLFTMAKQDEEFKSEYLKLTQKCETFAWEMLDLVRGRDELSLILDKSANGCSELARVRRVMDEGAKKFVAHPYVQRHLRMVFYGVDPNIRRRMLTTNNFLKTIFIVLALPVWILLFLAYILFGSFETLEKKSKFIKWNNMFLRTPCIKFYTHSFSYFTFLLILTIYFLPDDKANVAHAKDFRWSEYAIFFYVIGYLLAEVKQLCRQGMRYFQNAFNILDILLVMFYLASFVSRIVSIVKTRQAALEVNQTTTEAYTYYYQIGRFEWELNDPEIISDALFALANIISFSRLVYILPTFESVGPLLVVLGKMINDVFRFAALLLIVFIAFTVGLHNHYHFYAGQTLPDGSKTNSAFHGFFNTFSTLMWSIFGLGDSSSVEIHMKHAFVEIVGFIMVAIFHIVIVIMLINMLIAMMTISFEAIHSQMVVLHPHLQEMAPSKKVCPGFNDLE
ncbi:short transient receptor potential channel 6-like [Lingula anatina]|uniref:Short transient receptor potential channel 6-like n=1 Tax=Lingula anatina TaxID=7574 RepID=A0A1S3HFM4_LINAN|nr:short transient receptor potential channel 6-like [Lingula anatina]|eukprot:XP_013384878.2 short transient receptor potential channel 6-like [Lingula anatina]